MMMMMMMMRIPSPRPLQRLSHRAFPTRRGTGARPQSSWFTPRPHGRVTAAALGHSPTTMGRRFLSDGSHDDFAPQRKSVGSEDEALRLIDEHVKANRVMLYMKGNPSMPMCGFSARVVQILQQEGVDFASVNVLDYPTIREGIKKYSDWPTIPQLYVNAEFVGGCDIVTAMHESGELKELLQPPQE